LAGGSGITPFMSVLRSVYGREKGTPSLHIHLLYGSRTPGDVIYGRELAEMDARFPGFEVSLVVSEPPPDYQGLTGLLDADLIRSQVGGVEGKTFYICGPPVMYDFCLEALEELEVLPHKIKRELFGLPGDVTREPGWPQGLSPYSVFSVHVVGDKNIRAPAGEPLMNTLERYGIVVPALCRVGECSACRVRLLSGRVFMPEGASVRESDRQHGYIHACVSYPLEDLEIRLLG
jgi:ferredoxin-NADP reductase